MKNGTETHLVTQIYNARCRMVVHVCKPVSIYIGNISSWLHKSERTVEYPDHDPIPQSAPFSRGQSISMRLSKASANQKDENKIILVSASNLNRVDFCHVSEHALHCLCTELSNSLRLQM